MLEGRQFCKMGRDQRRLFLRRAILAKLMLGSRKVVNNVEINCGGLEQPTLMPAQLVMRANKTYSICAL